MKEGNTNLAIYNLALNKQSVIDMKRKVPNYSRWIDTDNNTFYNMGGRDNGAYLNTVWEYKMNNGQVTVKQSMIDKRFCFGIVFSQR